VQGFQQAVCSDYIQILASEWEILGEFGNASRHEIAAPESGGVPAHDHGNPVGIFGSQNFSEILKLGFQGWFAPGIHLP
jgi:hypothetical protein